MLESHTSRKGVAVSNEPSVAFSNEYSPKPKSIAGK
jgi:hypothetical protein